MANKKPLPRDTGGEAPRAEAHQIAVSNLALRLNGRPDLALIKNNFSGGPVNAS